MITYHLRRHRNRPNERCHFVIEAFDGETLAGRLTMATQDDTLGHAMDEGAEMSEDHAGVPGIQFAWLERLEVVETYQRQGVGRTLVEKAARRLGRLGFEWLYVAAYPLGGTTFENLIRFYRACDFRVDGRASNGGKLMSLFLFDPRE